MNQVLQLVIGYTLCIVIIILIIRYCVIRFSLNKQIMKFLNSNNIEKMQYNPNLLFRCNSLKQYRANQNNRQYIINYIINCIKQDEYHWREIYEKSNNNENIIDIAVQHFDDNDEVFNKIPKYLCVTKKSYNKIINKLFQNIYNNPIYIIKITVALRYSSPGGKNNYGYEIEIISSTIDEIFIRLNDMKYNEDAIDYQRYLMSNNMRYDVLRKDNFTCQLCGRTSKEGAKLEVDHIIPVSKGGLTTPSNLQTLCRECNRGKKAKL